MKKLFLLFFGFFLLKSAVSQDIIITEIMFNPASPESEWEWVEIYNNGVSSEDLSGWVLDDINSTAHSVANIASGSIDPGETAILYDDDVSPSDFEAAWGTV